MIKEIKTKLDIPFVDDRGYIQNLLFEPMGVSIIFSKAGSIRSNHWHKEDYHYLYVVSGEMLYWERNVGQPSEGIEPIKVKQGEMIFTGPKKVHKTEFTEDTILVSISKRPRDHEHHEEDVIREEFNNENK